jgi:3-hydroxybutyryl-CoA dehydrogenase
MKQIKTVVVCGAGTMGSGITQVCAMAGYKTIQFDVSEPVVDKSKISIQKSLEQLAQKNKITTQEQQEYFNNIVFTTNIKNCVGDLIIEAIIENITAKQELFNTMAQTNTASTIYVSNTSSISINLLAKNFVYPTQMAGLHFFNPAVLMKLVEVIKAPETDNKVIESLMAFCKSIKKTTVLCNDSPGFIVNRVARHYYLEAMQIVEQTNYSFEKIDMLLENAGFKMGPFKLMDLIGMDINYSVSKIVWEALDKPNRLKPSVIQEQKVKANHLGRKTGKGFYDYNN